MEPAKSSQLKFLEKALDFKFWFKRILKLWWAFLITGVIFGLAGYLYAKHSKVQYRSQVTFAIDDGNSSNNSIISLASELGIGTKNGSSLFNGDNIFGVLKSRRIIEGVLLSTDTFRSGENTYLEKYLILQDFFKDGKNSEFHFPPGISRAGLTYAQDSLLKKIYTAFSQSLIKVDRPDKRLIFYSLEVTTNSEEFTKRFTDRLMEQANQLYTDLTTEKSKQTMAVLEDQAAQIKQNLNSSISGKAGVQDANLNPAFSEAQVPVAQQQTNIQVYGGAYAELFKNLELARFQYLNSRPILQVIDKANYPMEKVKMSKLYTAIGFAAVGCILLFIILWIKRIWALSINSNSE